MKKFIKNLTPNKLKVIAIVINIIVAFAFVGINFISKPALIQELILTVCTPLFICIFSYFLYQILLIFNGFAYTKQRKTSISYLSKDKFTQLSFIGPYNKGELLSAILNAEGYRFFAKLKEDDNILLIVKNKNDDEIYNTIISNYLYFISRFKTIEN